jgi:hypothetical protein
MLLSKFHSLLCSGNTSIGALLLESRASPKLNKLASSLNFEYIVLVNYMPIVTSNDVSLGRLNSSYLFLFMCKVDDFADALGASYV